MKLIPAVSLLVPALVPALASAEPEPTDYRKLESADASAGFDHPVAPVANALEIAVGTGYTQGGGKLGGALGNLEDVSGPGAAFELDLGYRIIPQLTLGAYGTFSAYQHGDAIDSSTDVLGATAGLQAAWHFRPETSVDPWISLGAGWKGLWLNPSDGKVTSLQGLELARLQVGADYRITREIAIAPVIGGSLSMFVSQDSPMTTD
ncbi:MAG TPA: hypothetical protein VFT22_05980 [Kofleriaceae bacterium]|nr:hypothetical protein [Kofleriaceae bacterium]